MPAAATANKSEPADNVVKRSLASLKWSTLGELLSRSLQPFLVLAIGSRLGPAEFGLLGIATIALGIAQQLQDAGLGKTLIQTRENLDAASNTVFWVNLGLSSALFAGIALLAPWIGDFFQRMDCVPILRVLGWRLILLAMGAVQLARLQRELRFRVIFGARLASALVSFAVIVPLALLGQGVWSLVWGMVAGAATQTAWLWMGSAWRPVLRWEGNVFRAMFGFSRWVLLETVFGLVVNWSDSIVVGWKLGDAALGKYRLASSAISLTAGLLLQPMLPVALSAFAKLKGTMELGHLHGLVTRLALMVAGAQMVLLFFLGEDLVSSMLSSKWAGTAPLLFLLASKLSVDWVSGFNSQAFTAAGRPDLVAKQLMVVASVTLPVMFVAAGRGAEALAAARVAVAGVDSAISVALAGALLGLGFKHAGAALLPALGACLVSGLALWGLDWLPMSHGGRLAVGLASGSLLYLAVWDRLAPGGLRAMGDLLRRRAPVRVEN